MPSEAVRFIPAFRGPIEGYAVKAIHRLYPQVKHRYEYEDLYQEAAEVYLSCRRRYVVDNPAWFMALYKLCLFSRLANIVNNCCKHGRCESFEALFEVESEPRSFSHPQMEVACVAELTVLINQIPMELAEVVQALVSDVTNTLPARRKGLYRKMIEAYLL